MSQISGPMNPTIGRSEVERVERVERVEPATHTTASLSGAGGLAEALAAAGVVVLSILALAGILPMTFLSIACIAAGAGLIFEGGAVAARASRIMSRARGGDSAELEGGIAAEALAGAAGVALGILALIGISPTILTAVSALVFGAGMLFGSGARAKLNSLPRRSVLEGGSVSSTLDETVFVSAGGEVLVGVGAVVLGILALLGIAPVTLTLIAFLAIGGSLLLSGTAVGARMLSVVHA